MRADRLCDVQRCPSKHAFRVVRGEREYSLHCDAHTCRAANPSTMAFCTKATEHGRMYCSNHGQCSYQGCCITPHIHPSSLHPFICDTHTCPVRDCKKPKHAINETCGGHVTKCRFHTCNQATRHREAYCPLHQCSITGCFQDRDLSTDKQSQFCGIHTCRVNNCPNAVRNTLDTASHFCDTHECRTQSCLLRADVLGGHCANHGCNTPGCVKTKVSKGYFCSDHECRQPKCSAAAESAGGFCRVHNCIRPKCVNQNTMDGNYPGLCYMHVMDAVREEATNAAHSHKDHPRSASRSSIRTEKRESEKLRAEKLRAEKLRAEQLEAEIRKAEQRQAKKQREQELADERLAEKLEAERLRKEVEYLEAQKRARERENERENERERERRRERHQAEERAEKRAEERRRADAIAAETARHEKRRRQQERRTSFTEKVYNGRDRSRRGDSGATASGIRQRAREHQKMRDAEQALFIQKARNKLQAIHDRRLSEFEHARFEYDSDREFYNVRAALARDLKSEMDTHEAHLTRSFARGDMDDYLDRVVGRVIDIHDDYTNASSDESTSSYRYGGSEFIA